MRLRSYIAARRSGRPEAKRWRRPPANRRSAPRGCERIRGLGVGGDLGEQCAAARRLALGEHRHPDHLAGAAEERLARARRAAGSRAITWSGLSCRYSSAVPRTVREVAKRLGGRLVVGGDLAHRRVAAACDCPAASASAARVRPAVARTPSASDWRSGVELRRAPRHACCAPTSCERRRQLLGAGLGELRLAVLPEQIAADREQEQDDARRSRRAIALGACRASGRGEDSRRLRERSSRRCQGEAPNHSSSIVWAVRRCRLHSPPRMNKSWRRRSSAGGAKGKEGAFGPHRCAADLSARRSLRVTIHAFRRFVVACRRPADPRKLGRTALEPAAAGAIASVLIREKQEDALQRCPRNSLR